MTASQKDALVLNNLKKSLYIDFGDVCQVGKPAIKKFTLVNPFPKACTLLWENLEKLDEFKIVFEVQLEKNFLAPNQENGTLMDGNSKVDCRITWKPSRAGVVRTCFQALNLRNNITHNIFVKGISIKPTVPPMLISE
jgi:hypothetical protein